MTDDLPSYLIEKNYICNDCRARLHLSDASVKKCPRCQSENVEKIQSPYNSLYFSMGYSLAQIAEHTSEELPSFTTHYPSNDRNELDNQIENSLNLIAEHINIPEEIIRGTQPRSLIRTKELQAYQVRKNPWLLLPDFFMKHRVRCKYCKELIPKHKMKDRKLCPKCYSMAETFLNWGK